MNLDKLVHLIIVIIIVITIIKIEIESKYFTTKILYNLACTIKY